MNKAVILLSGGLDSATTLYIAKQKGFNASCLIFDYGQRHKKEIENAKKVARSSRSDYKIVKISFPWKGSALTDLKQKVPDKGIIDEKKIPSTYVPARNIIFLSFAASYAEAIGARTVFIGVNAIDYSGYPDCRPEFIKAFQQVMYKGLKSGVNNKKIILKTPLIKKTKSEIIKLGNKLNVPYHLTWSCYKGGKLPCGVCDSCRLRAKGFKEAGATDPVIKK